MSRMCINVVLQLGSEDIHEHLQSSNVANSLRVVGSNDLEDAFKCYIHDFVLLSCGLPEENDINKV